MTDLFVIPVSFSITQGTNVSFVYCIDSFRPVAGEVAVTQLAFKCMYRSSFSKIFLLEDPSDIRECCSNVRKFSLSLLRIPAFVLHQPMD